MMGSFGQGWTGVVLAGGRSSRMGTDKALLPWPGAGGRPLVEHALDLLAPHVQELLVLGDPARYGHLGPFVIPDDKPGEGPLQGLLSAMRYAANDKLLVLAVDMPCVDAHLLAALQAEAGHFTDAVVPRHAAGLEPLVAAYHRRSAQVLQAAFESGTRRMTDALQLLRTTYLPVEPGTQHWAADLFRNINRPEDLG